MDLLFAEGARCREVRVHLEPFTLIAATTRPGALSTPLVARFTSDHFLTPYGHQELVAIAKRGARDLGFEISGVVARELARRSRGTPRLAKTMLRRAAVKARAAGRREIRNEDVVAAAESRGIGAHGLLSEDHVVLRVLLTSPRPIGIDRLAAQAGIEARRVRRVIEPYLYREGFLACTDRGRAPTAKARALFAPRPCGDARDGSRGGSREPESR